MPGRPARLVGSVRPRLHTPPLRQLNRRTSRGYEVVAFAEMIGEPLQPWQAWLCKHALELRPDGTYRFRPDLVDRLSAAKAWVNPTLYVMKAGIEKLREAREREGQLTPDLAAKLDESRRALDVRVDAVRRMNEAGVRMTAGSDSPWGWYAPGEFVHEIHMLAQAGLSYSDAIVAGTASAADSIGVGAVAGRLTRGRLADVLVVGGDPTREITALWDVLDVYQAGRRIERGVL